MTAAAVANPHPALGRATFGPHERPPLPPWALVVTRGVAADVDRNNVYPNSSPSGSKKKRIGGPSGKLLHTLEIFMFFPPPFSIRIFPATSSTLWRGSNHFVLFVYVRHFDARPSAPPPPPPSAPPPAARTLGAGDRAASTPTSSPGCPWAPPPSPV